VAPGTKDSEARCVDQMTALLAMVSAVAAIATPHTAQHDAVASWYYDAGQTASGRHYHYGFASLLFSSRWGTRIRFCHAGRCVVGRLDDHGPYVAGRTFDLNPALRDALRCGGICYVRWDRPVVYGVLRARMP
jgi:rare lipoprotein A (peptidoglycan hydrolase)